MTTPTPLSSSSFSFNPHGDAHEEFKYPYEFVATASYYLRLDEATRKLREVAYSDGSIVSHIVKATIALTTLLSVRTRPNQYNTQLLGGIVSEVIHILVARTVNSYGSDRTTWNQSVIESEIKSWLEGLFNMVPIAPSDLGDYIKENYTPLDGVFDEDGLAPHQRRNCHRLKMVLAAMQRKRALRAQHTTTKRSKLN